MNVLSVFDGMSCGRIALERAGVPVNNYYASEIDKAAIKVSKNNWGGIEHIGDVTKVCTALLPKIDLLIGGSPCQGFSFAGLQLNFNDPRSKLFFEFVRLLKDIREENPDVYFLLENVFMSKKHEDVITGYLKVQPLRINSGVTTGQNRKRIFWTNIPKIDLPIVGKPMREILDSEVDDKYLLINNYNIPLKLNPEINRLDVFEKNYKIQKPSTTKPGLVAHVINDTPSNISRQNDRLYCIDSLSPCLTATGASAIKINTGGRDKTKWRTITPSEAEKLQGVPVGYTDCVSEYQRFKMLGNGWNIDAIERLFLPIGKLNFLY